MVGTDTNIFVYFLDKESPFYSQAEKFFKHVADQKITIVTSILTFTELLSLKAPQATLDKLEDELLLIPNMNIIDVQKDIAKTAAAIRRSYGFMLPDSIQLATAILAKSDAFVTNDERLKGFKRLPIILLKSI